MNQNLPKFEFDTKNMKRHYNGELVIAHSYHYASLLTQLAIDMKIEDLLINSSQDSFYPVIKNRISAVETVEEKIIAIKTLYANLGLGKIEEFCLGQEGGEVKLSRSHFDEGWLKKWGKSERPVNLIGSGFITAAYCVLLNLPLRALKAVERNSIAKAERYSFIQIYKAS